MVDGKEHRTDTKGSLVPITLVKPRDLLQDETTRKIMGYAIALSEQASRFKAHVAEDISLFEEILALEYEAKIGGPKGNKTIMPMTVFSGSQSAPQINTSSGPSCRLPRAWSTNA